MKVNLLVCMDFKGRMVWFGFYGVGNVVWAWLMVNWFVLL